MIKQEWKLPLVAFACGAILALLFCGYRLITQQARLRETQSELAKVWAETEGLKESQSRQVALYFISEESGESLLVPELREISPTTQPEQAALRELVKGPVTEGLQSVLPKKTTIRALKISNGLAVVDFSREAVRIDRGSWGEALVVWSVVNTLTKFPQVEAVQILIEGEPVETFAGHFGLSQPLRRNEQVIRDDWTH